MSASPITNSGNGGQIEAVIKLMMEQMLNGSIITSSGGDSPKDNKFKFIGEAAGFGDAIENAIQVAVLSHMEENGMFGGLPSSDTSGLTKNQKIGIASRGLSSMQNPQQLVSEGLGMLPHAVIVSFALTLIPVIIKELTKPGGPFDLRFKRMMDQEMNAFMDRQTQHDIRIGHRGIIIQGRAGFINKNGAHGNTNTLRMIRDGGIDKSYLNQVDYIDHTKGLFT